MLFYRHRAVIAVGVLCIFLSACGNNTTTIQEAASDDSGQQESQEMTEAEKEEESEAEAEDELPLYDENYVPNMMRDEAYGTRIDPDEYVRLGTYTGLKVDDPDVSELDFDEETTERYIKGHRQSEALKQIISNATFDTPPFEMQERHEELLYRALGMQAYYLEQAGEEKTEAEILAESMEEDGFEGDAKAYLRKLTLEKCYEELVVCAIAKKEGFTVSESELSEEMEQMLAENGYESAEEYTEAAGMDIEEMLRIDLLYEKVLEFVLE